MLRRSLRALPAVLTLASFFGAGFGEARAIVPCPHHDALPGLEHRAAGMEGHTGHGPMAEPDGGPSDPGASQHPHGDGHAHGPCTCLGCSCAPGALPLPSFDAAAVVAFGVPRVELAPPPPATAIAHRARHLRSPHRSQAPPRSI